jgi:hypothetical protein
VSGMSGVSFCQEVFRGDRKHSQVMDRAQSGWDDYIAAFSGAIGIIARCPVGAGRCSDVLPGSSKYSRGTRVVRRRNS